MISAEAPFILLDDARSEGAVQARLYSDPVETLVAHDGDALTALLAGLRTAGKEGLHAAGYFSYEAGLLLEPRLAPLLPADRPAAIAWFGLFRDYQAIVPEEVPGWLPPATGVRPQLIPAISRDDYATAFTQAHDRIAAGDIYQVNLTFPMIADWPLGPLDLYAALRPAAAAGHGGIVHDGNNWMLSFSPELFFSVRGRRITARPMKGTAQRPPGPAADAAAARALQTDPKQRAENLMIVDLLRNDLSRIAAPGTVSVPALFTLEQYPTVYQMTSTVTALLADGRDVIDIIAALYPCGSITGAPKIRAMEIIAGLERRARGIYCGSIGRIDPGGDAAFNVAIRTFQFDPARNRLSLGLGSGIVADSEAESEWAECLAKGVFAQ